MANYYVIQTGTTAPDLAGTPYEGYEIRTVSQMNNAFSGTRVAANDNVVVDGSVREKLWLNTAAGQTNGMDLNVTVLANTNTFEIEVGTSTETRVSLNVDVEGNASRVSLPRGSRLFDMTVNVADDAAIGNINGGGQSLTVTTGTNATVGNITSTNTQTDTITLGDGTKVGNITSGAGGLELTTGVSTNIGDINGTLGADRIVIGDASTTGKITSRTGDDYIEIGSNAIIRDDIYSSVGHDTIIIGNGTKVEGNVYTGDGINIVFDRDSLTLGDEVWITGHVFTGGQADGEGDTLILGDAIRIDGTYAATGAHIYMNLGSHNVTSTGWGEYKVDLAGGSPNDDLLRFRIGAIEESRLREELTKQGFSPNSDSPYAGEIWYKSPNATFTWKGVEYQRVDWIEFRICFAADTMIDTVNGPVAVQDLRVGDMVITRDNGPQPIRWIDGQQVPHMQLRQTPTLQPIRIARGALGPNTPSQDLVVSPQHRVLVRSRIAQKMFGTDEVLVAAKQLLQIDGIDIATDLDTVTYYHFLFDQHEIVMSNGAETESLFTGPEALKTVSDAAREEIFALFPQLRDHDYEPETARHFASGRMARKLAVRHARNAKPLVN
ncbi:Hint domain-containing protein [Paracoccus sp. (in: a-proteobacteria)]|uniref:Hint domain-containing protein n=1 Tax=Paracoccus sp. TaxID=267 RepID=UPI0026E037FF|nr:Hint domain-containing protein [Paracoccus sp. (in: a-proteobacteria)]MDO5648201.1 Hint domain-containing protein [Paracoccus sp. (in: a-proteobacteria)]